MLQDNWEDEEEEEEEEEKKDEEKQEAKQVKVNPKKSLKEKIAEKERLKKEQDEEKERERIDSMTPEEKLAEKLRIQKVQEESDLRAAMETFGVTEKFGIDGMNPTNKAELTEFCEALSKKISQFKDLDDYTGFLEDLIRNVSVSCKSNRTKHSGKSKRSCLFCYSQYHQSICRRLRNLWTTCTQKK